MRTPSRSTPILTQLDSFCGCVAGVFDRVVGMVLGSSTEEKATDEEAVDGATPHPSGVDATGSSAVTVEIDGKVTEIMGAEQDGSAAPNDGIVGAATSSVPQPAATVSNGSTTSIPEDVVAIPDMVPGSSEQMAGTPAESAVMDTTATVKNDTESVADIESAAPTSAPGDTAVNGGNDVHGIASVLGSASKSIESASTEVEKLVISPEELAAAVSPRMQNVRGKSRPKAMYMFCIADWFCFLILAGGEQKRHKNRRCDHAGRALAATRATTTTAARSAAAVDTTSTTAAAATAAAAAAAAGTAAAAAAGTVDFATAVVGADAGAAPAASALASNTTQSSSF